MNINSLMGGHKKIILALIPVLIILLPLGYGLVSSVVAGGTDTSQPYLERPDPKYENCVRDSEYMRFHHWELLRGIREEVVRYGIRGDIGLNKCQECHTSREKFCDQCHNAVTMTPDCFDCHYYPQ